MGFVFIVCVLSVDVDLTVLCSSAQVLNESSAEAASLVLLQACCERQIAAAHRASTQTTQGTFAISVAYTGM
jgi:hypothetical protein